jgi:hypothetical protein
MRARMFNRQSFTSCCQHDVLRGRRAAHKCLEPLGPTAHKISVDVLLALSVLRNLGALVVIGRLSARTPICWRLDPRKRALADRSESVQN